jgi:hypothetical protein
MAVDVHQSRSRRAMLAALGGTVLGVAGSLMSRPARVLAVANGNVQLGHGFNDTDNDSAVETRVNATADGITAFSAHQPATGYGIYGLADGGTGILGTSFAGTGVGVHGSNTTTTGTGVQGDGFYGPTSSSVGVLGTGIYGVYGSSGTGGIGMLGSASLTGPASVYGFTGVIGQADAGGTGVVGFIGAAEAAPPPDVGVYGRADSNGTSSRGVKGQSTGGVGVMGQTVSGVAVYAYCPTNTGVGLRVTGKAAFDRSGKVTVTAGHSSVAKTGLAMTSSSFIIATLQTNVAGLYIQAVVPNPAGSSFTIYLNKAPTKNVVVAWIAVN